MCYIREKLIAYEETEQKYGFSIREVANIVLEDATLAELEQAKASLAVLLPKLTKWRVEELQHQIAEYYTKAWAHRKTPKYGTLRKDFSKAELDRFLGVIKDDRFSLLFKYQAYLALRIGEVVLVNTNQFNWDTREIKVQTEKAHTLDTLRLPVFLFEETLEYVKKHEKEIEQNEGYLFYPDKQKSRSKGTHFNLNYVRKVFRYYSSMAGLTEVYATTDESIPNRAKRQLHRLSSHSLRHFGITQFNRAVKGDIVLTQRYARHQDISSTQVYIHTSKEELYDAIETAFSSNSVKPIMARV